MLHYTSGKRAAGLLISTVVFALGATSATASAAQALCIGAAGTPVTVADAEGTCKAKGAIPKTLVEKSELDAANTRIAALETKVGSLETKVSSLQTKLSKVSYTASGLNGLPTLKIDGANLQIVSGSGATDGVVNGLGNLFIGYNDKPYEDSGSPYAGSPRFQWGSHNLVMGTDQSFEGYGGLITGRNNELSGPFNTVLGGQFNTARGTGLSVIGGIYNTASGTGTSVTGGFSNTARGDWSSVTGGYYNTASGSASSVSGGQSNTAAGEASSILGGRGVTLSGSWETSPSG